MKIKVREYLGIIDGQWKIMSIVGDVIVSRELNWKDRLRYCGWILLSDMLNPKCIKE